MIFCTEYLKDLNGSRAYKVAYPTCKKDSTALSNSSKLLKNTNVKNYIEEKLKEIESEKIMSVKETLERLTSIARGQTREEHLNSFDEIITLKTKKKDELKALELLGKYHALFTDKLDTNVNITPTIIEGGGELEE
ncbi:MAG: terminase small subunit [Eubacteriales bacterium]|nr:terminase small subunit [Eubacteriales bacterium]